MILFTLLVSMLLSFIRACYALLSREKIKQIPVVYATMKRYSVHPNNKTARPDDDKEKKNLHKSLKYILIIGQCLAQIPVQGITGKDPKSLYFTWKSARTAYSIISCCGTSVVICVFLHRMITKGTDLFIISDIVLNSLMLTVSIFLIQLGRSSPQLMKEWYIVEVSMRSYGWPKNLDLRLNIMTLLVTVIAIIQFILLHTSKFVMAVKCSGQMDVLEYYYVVENYPYIFSSVNYSVIAGLFFQFIEILTTFSWIYIDLFIIAMSTSLALRFRQVTKRLFSIGESKVSLESTWREIREDYNRLCKLCKSLDDAISYIILMSFAGNLFFILIQLFKSLRIMKNSLERVYFFYSFGFLIMRTVFVSLYGAWVNDESKKPVPILNSVPSNVYNLEIRRFIQQIGFDTVSLTGRNFFSVTRGLILSIAGAIVTYELVLIQFNENLLKETPTNKTTSKC